MFISNIYHVFSDSAADLLVGLVFLLFLLEDRGHRGHSWQSAKVLSSVLKTFLWGKTYHYKVLILDTPSFNSALQTLQNSSIKG